jgi:Domain of unknown function (DUF4350)
MHHWLRSIGLCLIASLVLSASVSAQSTDLTTALPQSPATQVQLPTPPDGACQVLWDLTHGPYLDYTPTGGFSDLVAQLAGDGFNVSTTAAGVDNISLTPYRILVICEISNYNSPYTPAEVAAIQTFVGLGGGLLVMAENTDLPNNVGPVAQAFGTTTEVFYLDPLDYYFNNFAAHPIFAGISQLYYRAGGALNGGGLTPAVAFGPAGEEVVTAASADRVVILGDSNLFSNGLFDTADNRAFARNVFAWLCSGNPTPTRDSTWGRMKSLYR